MAPRPEETFRAALRDALTPLADAQRAAQMQAYMKSSLPYLGAPMTATRRTSKALAKELTFDSFAAFERFVRGLYGRAAFREERYAALTLLDLKQTRAFQTVEAFGLYEWLIVEGAWWDLVDEVATHRFVRLLEVEPAAMKKRLRAWSRGSNLWLRRAAIIAQVLRGEETDLALLFEVILPAVGEKEFFLRKAIGWALRAAGKSFPREVRAFVEAHRSRLSGLSIREAEKSIGAR